MDSLALFNRGTVIPTGECIHRLRGDHGTELTNADVRQYCLDTGIKLDVASQNTPEQIGANERAGRTIVNIVRCLFADSGLPKSLLGGSDASGCLPEQPVSTRGPEQLDAVQGPLRQGYLPRAP